MIGRTVENEERSLMVDDGQTDRQLRDANTAVAAGRQRSD